MPADAGSASRAASRLSRANRSALQAMPYLIDLVQAGAVLAPRQRSQEQGIGDDEARRVEGADEVLAGREVHADLAADRRVDLRQQRRRHLDERDAAQEGRGREARHVADDAAPDGHDDRPAVGAPARPARRRFARPRRGACAARRRAPWMTSAPGSAFAIRSPWKRHTTGFDTTNRRGPTRAVVEPLRRAVRSTPSPIRTG